MLAPYFALFWHQLPAIHCGQIGATEGVRWIFPFFPLYFLLRTIIIYLKSRPLETLACMEKK